MCYTNAKLTNLIFINKWHTHGLEYKLTWDNANQFYFEMQKRIFTKKKKFE